MCVLSIKLISGELEEYMLQEYYYLRYSDLIFSNNKLYIYKFDQVCHMIKPAFISTAHKKGLRDRLIYSANTGSALCVPGINLHFHKHNPI